MDFQEFMGFIKNAKERKEYFDYYLIKRFEVFVKTKDILLKVKIVDDNFQFQNENYKLI